MSSWGFKTTKTPGKSSQMYKSNKDRLCAKGPCPDDKKKWWCWCWLPPQNGAYAHLEAVLTLNKLEIYDRFEPDAPETDYDGGWQEDYFREAGWGASALLRTSSRRDAGTVRQCERKPPSSSNQPIPKHVSPVEFPHANSHCRAPFAAFKSGPGLGMPHGRCAHPKMRK